MSTTDKLRQAATVLRERAEACDPWQGDDTHSSWADEYRSDGGNGTDAALIRLMHPGVALALADWLDTAANNAERNGWMAGYTEAMRGTSAVRIADLILGSQP